jgi:hypothetical protein
MPSCKWSNESAVTGCRQIGQIWSNGARDGRCGVEGVIVGGVISRIGSSASSK